MSALNSVTASWPALARTRPGQTFRRVLQPISYRLIHRNWLAGKYVEWTGNRVKYEGLMFDVSDPSISTTIKGRFLFGAYERPEAISLKRYLDREMPVIEVGACLGVVSCFTNSLLRDPRRHVVVEANPHLMPVIERNRRMNNCSFQALHRALAYDAEEVEFFIDEWVISSALQTDRSDVQKARRMMERVLVPATTVARTADEAGFDRVSVIVDIEGAEVEMVDREIDFMKRRVHQLFLETHARLVGDEATQSIIGKLKDVGFKEVATIKTQVVMENVRN